MICRRFLGDIILTRPVFRNLRAHMPHAQLTAAGETGRMDALSLFPEVDDRLEIPRHLRAGCPRFARHWRALLSELRDSGWISLFRELRERRFDLVYDLMQSDRSTLITWATRAPIRVGYIKGRERWRHRFYTHTAEWTAEDLATTHTRDLYLKPLVALGIPIRTRSIAVTLRPEEMTAARARLQQVLPRRDGPLVVVHPGAGAPPKCWPPEDFAATCDDLQMRLNAQVLLLAGKGEAESLRVLRSSIQTEAAVIEDALSTRELAALLREADLYLGNDSGPMHLAAAVGTRVVGLYGASSPVTWRPLGEGHCVLRPPMPCTACPFPRHCRPPNEYAMLCVRRITRDEVRGALERQLGHWDDQAGQRARIGHVDTVHTRRCDQSPVEGTFDA